MSSHTARALVAAFVAALVGGCTLAPAQVAGPAGGSLDAHPTEAAIASPAGTTAPAGTAMTCSVTVTPDEVGHGIMIRADGYTPDSPLVMTFTYPGGTTTYTDAELRQLQSDIRGVFELHWYALRETAGDNSLEISGGGCSASDTFPVLAEWFPEADCIAASEPAPGDGDESAAYAETVLASEPFSYWRFEEESGASTMSSTAETGELMNDAVLGEPGFMDGSRSVLLVENPEPPDIGGWVDMPDLELDEDFTIEAWYRFCGEFIWFQDALVGQGEEGPDINWAELHARLWTGNSDVLVSANLVGSAGWHHLAVTRGDGELVMYEDGVQTATGSYSDPLPIKAIGNGSGGTFGGWLDEVAFYDHALSAEQIEEHAAFGQ